ncbi:ferredoxin [Cryptosporangium sp. NPDC048952]|uniref:ferredoxin n=1 Tax=Cryptosporangium sp. NPDC048952 TaxID=3363961 RepID=UPI00371889DB
MKLFIDAEKCCGFGECIALAPDVFRMGADNRVEFVTDGTVEDTEADRVSGAVYACPTEALGILE